MKYRGGDLMKRVSWSLLRAMLALIIAVVVEVVVACPPAYADLYIDGHNWTEIGGGASLVSTYLLPDGSGSLTPQFGESEVLLTGGNATVADVGRFLGFTGPTLTAFESDVAEYYTGVVTGNTLLGAAIKTTVHISSPPPTIDWGNWSPSPQMASAWSFTPGTILTYDDDGNPLTTSGVGEDHAGATSYLNDGNYGVSSMSEGGFYGSLWQALMNYAVVPDPYIPPLNNGTPGDYTIGYYNFGDGALVFASNFDPAPLPDPGSDELLLGLGFIGWVWLRKGIVMAR